MILSPLKDINKDQSTLKLKGIIQENTRLLVMSIK